MNASAPLAIVSAMAPELQALLPLLEGARQETVAGRRLHRGRLCGQEVVLTLCGIGKVAAALTTTLLIERCGVQALLFTGVAGGIGPDVAVGDVVVARRLLQHDLDVSPLFPRHHVPDLGRALMDTDEGLSTAMVQAALAVLDGRASARAAGGAAGGAAGRAAELASAPQRSARAAQVHEGLVVSGDRFVSTSTESRALALALPDALAVEMEGAAMAQVCTAYGLPCAMVRSISDRADDQAHVDFNRFLAEVASPLSRDIVLRTLECWRR